jgi:glycolate oxidase
LESDLADVGRPVAGSCLLIVAFEGHPVAVEREVRDMVRMVGEARSLVLIDPEHVARLWSALSKQRESARSLGYPVEVKLSVPLSDLWDVLGLACSGEEAADGGPMWTASAGSGTARVWLGRSSKRGSDTPWTLSAESVALLLSTRAAAERKGGSLVVVDGGQALGAGFGVWGSDPDALAVMRALKSKFDPRGQMNPGRCAGGL